MKILRAVISLFLAFTLMLSVVPQASAESMYYVYIPKANTNLRSGPGIEYEVKGRTARAGNLYYVGAQFDSVDILWYLIEDGAGFSGWVSSDVSRRYMKKAYRPEVDEIVIPEPDGTAYNEVSRVIAAEAKEANAIAVQVAAIRGSDGSIFDWTLGWSKYGVEPLTRSTKFRMASISKVAVAVSAAQMQDQGILSMTRRIDRYWGGEKLPRPVSLATLLTHTSTLNYLSVKPTKEQLLAQLLDTGSYSDKDVGTLDSWYYNNYASAIAAATLELAAGRKLEDYAQENLFGPLGVDMTFFAGNIKSPEKLATLYEADHGLELTVREASYILPDGDLGGNAGNYIGGLTASSRDVAKMMYMLANDGEFRGQQLLKPETVDELEKTYFTASEYGGEFRQATILRYREGAYGTNGVYYHTGNAYGVLSLACYDPLTKDIVVVTTTGAANTRSSDGVYKICDDIADAVYRNLADVVKP